MKACSKNPAYKKEEKVIVSIFVQSVTVSDVFEALMENWQIFFRNSCNIGRSFTHD